MKPVTLAWWIWALAVCLIISAGYAYAVQQPEKPPICMEGYCVVSERVLREIAETAKMALEYRELCKWP